MQDGQLHIEITEQLSFVIVFSISDALPGNAQVSVQRGNTALQQVLFVRCICGGGWMRPTAFCIVVSTVLRRDFQQVCVFLQRIYEGLDGSAAFCIVFSTVPAT